MAHIPEGCETITPEQWSKLAEELEKDAKNERAFAAIQKNGTQAAETLEAWAFCFRERSMLARFKQKMNS